MKAKLLQKDVGPWPMSTYLVVCEQTLASAIIDPGEDGQDILDSAAGTNVEAILITHAHYDHINALAEVKEATGAPIYLHPADAEKFGVEYDIPLNDGDTITIGNLQLRVIHAPGHTPGQVCFDLGDNRIVVGDTVFVNGPGKTMSPEDFTTTIQTMENIVFAWPDEIEFFPGHGPSGKIEQERPAYKSFVARGWSSDLHGDVSWK